MLSTHLHNAFLVQCRNKEVFNSSAQDWLLLAMTGSYHPEPVGSDCFVHQKGTDLSSRTFGTNAGWYVHTQHFHQKFDLFSNVNQNHKSDNHGRDAFTPACFISACRAIIDVCLQRTCIGQQQWPRKSTNQAPEALTCLLVIISSHNT